MKCAAVIVAQVEIEQHHVHRMSAAAISSASAAVPQWPAISKSGSDASRRLRLSRNRT